MNSISQVEYFSGTSLVRVSLQFAIEEAIIAENSSCFILACLSPLLNYPLLNRLDMCSKNNKAQYLLHELASIDARDLSKIPSFFCKNNDLHISSVMSTKDWIYHWESTKEVIASSILGLHFGHYKV